MIETNFEKYRRELTQEQFIDSMILNCDGCPIGSPVCSCDAIIVGETCEEILREWCESIATGR